MDVKALGVDQKKNETQWTSTTHSYSKIQLFNPKLFLTFIM